MVLFAFAGRGSTTSRTSMSIFRATRWSFSPGFRARGNRRFGTLYAEAQRRYLESISPYARRLFHQMGVPEVDEIDGLPPAVALQQQRGSPTTRSSVGTVTTLSNLLRMLYSRAGTYPANCRNCMPRNFHRTVRRVPAHSATGWAESMRRPSARWCRMTRSPFASARSRRGRWPGMARTCGTFWSRLAMTSIARGANSRARIAIGFCSPMSSRPCRFTQASLPKRRGARSSAKRSRVIKALLPAPGVIYCMLLRPRKAR